MEHTFELGQHVKIVTSGEEGFVIGIAKYLESNPMALIRYRAADGRAVESWWHFSALEA